MSTTRVAFKGLIFAVLIARLMGQSLNNPVWTYDFSDLTQLSTNRASSRPETNRSAGIALWDEDHLFVYSLLSTGGLANRESHDRSAGAWIFLVRVLSSRTGKIEQSSTIPAGSFSSEIALTRGGIIVSDPGRLTFYSRSFEKLPSTFPYKPLIESVQNLPPLFARSLAGHIYATPNGEEILLVDSYDHHARIYIFDGKTFQNMVSGYLDEIDPRSVSVGTQGFFILI
jgi:hypothetical protein